MIHSHKRLLEVSQLMRHLGDLVFRPGVVNLDLADLLVTSKGGIVLIMTCGTAQPGSRAAKTSIRNAIGNPLCDVDLSTVRKALIHVVSNQNMTLEDSLVATEFLRTRIRETARIIWGVTLVDDPEEDMEVLLIMATTPMELLIHWYNAER
jgi:cell division protein FtsZ